MLSPRMQPSAWVLKSRLGQLAGARAHQKASARARGLHPGQSAPWAARCRSCSSSRQRTSAGVAPRASRALGSSLPLVLIEPSSHVRGGCTPGKSRLRQLAGARAHQEASARPRRAANETLPSKKELESCPPPYLTSEGQIKEKARKYAASAYLPLLFSPALGQLLVGPLSHGCAVPASRLPPRSAAGQRPTGT